MPEIHEGAPAVRIRCDVLDHAEIRAGAEGTAGARERHGPDVPVRLDRRARGFEIAQQLRTDRIELRRAVEHDVRDTGVSDAPDGARHQ